MVIHFYEARLGEKFPIKRCRAAVALRWNNKQLDITDHYCLVEIKQSGQRRFIPLCFGLCRSSAIFFFLPRKGRNQRDAIKGRSQFLACTAIIENLITERQNLMREILCVRSYFFSASVLFRTRHRKISPVRDLRTAGACAGCAIFFKTNRL